MMMRADEEQWSNLRQFWNSREGKEKAQLTMEKSDILLKGIVKRFFNEKEVTSTLVMDALYCGCRALDIAEDDLEDKATSVSVSNKCSVAMSVVQNKAVLTGDFVSALERAADGTAFDADEEDKKSASDDLSATDAVERDEKRLAELGRRTIEMYVLSHVFVNRVEIAFREAEALMRQEALIAEEEEAERLAQELEGQKKSKKQKQKERQRQKKALEDAEKAEKEAEEARIREEAEAAKEAERAAKAAAKAAALAEERAREEAEAAIRAKAEAEARAAREAKAAAKAAERAKREAEERAKEEEARKLKEEADAKAAAEAAAKAIPPPKVDSPSTPTRTKSTSQVSSPSKVIPAPLSNEVSTLRTRISQLELQLDEKTSECAQLTADLDKAKDIILQLRSDMVSGVPSMSMQKRSSMDSLGDVARTAQTASAMLGDTTNLVRMGSSTSIIANGAHNGAASSGMQPILASAKSQPPLPPGPPPPGSGDVGPPPPPRGPPPPGSARVNEPGPASPQHSSNSGLPPSFAAMAAGSRPPEPPAVPPGMSSYGQQPPGMGQLGTPPSMKTMVPPPGMGHPSTWSPGIQEEFPHLGMISDLLDFD
jgi:chemotaxis protein histidine kinase CheA